MQITFNTTVAQDKALGFLNVKDSEEFASAGFANKIKGSVSNSLKSFAKTALDSYARLPKQMKAVMTADQFLTVGAQEAYDVLVALGGREVKPLPELLADILEAKDSE